MNRDRHRLLHIRDAIARIREYATTREGFFAEARTQDAVIRNLEVIGEAVKALAASTRESAPSVRWASIAGMRDRLIHGYFAVDLELVWDVVDRELPALDAAVSELLMQTPE